LNVVVITAMSDDDINFVSIYATVLMPIPDDIMLMPWVAGAGGVADQWRDGLR
jgi:hypothetical protein